jgi:tetratricopeptide (TPR) repeat protein
MQTTHPSRTRVIRSQRHLSLKTCSNYHHSHSHSYLKTAFPSPSGHTFVIRQSPTSSTSCLRALPPYSPSSPLEAVTPLFDLSEGLETPVQAVYLAFLLGFLSVGAFLVVRQVLIRRELEEAAKVLGERVRAGEATAEDQFELGVILLRKKLFTQATKALEKARKQWEGEPEELAQVHNALGYSYFNLENIDRSIMEYRRAVELQPGYVTAWNNLGDALESQKKYTEALDAYNEALSYAPDNKVARTRADYCQTRVNRSIGTF